MSKAAKLRELVARSEPTLLIGAHNGLTAKLAEEAGFDAVWAGGFEICAARGMPDASVLTMAEHLAVTSEINDATELKVVELDGDGATLMSLGSLALARHLRLPNLEHIILDNGTCASTGDQPTCSAAIDFGEVGFNVRVIRVEPGNEPKTPRIPYDLLEMRRRFEVAARRRA